MNQSHQIKFHLSNTGFLQIKAGLLFFSNDRNSKDTVHWPLQRRISLTEEYFQILLFVVQTMHTIDKTKNHLYWMHVPVQPPWDVGLSGMKTTSVGKCTKGKQSQFLEYMMHILFSRNTCKVRTFNLRFVCFHYNHNNLSIFCGTNVQHQHMERFHGNICCKLKTKIGKVIVPQNINPNLVVSFLGLAF